MKTPKLKGMTMSAATEIWSADPLTWGQGPRVLEVFLEPTCPFSGKTFNKLDALLAKAGEEQLTIKVRLLSQPWHLLSGIIVRCILAASTTQSGKAAAKAVLSAVIAHREAFEFDDHCRGPNLDFTPRDVIARIEDYSGVDVAAAFDFSNLDREMKWHSKYARQNGAHFTPTFMVDGVINPAMSSGDSIETWLDALGLSAKP